MSKKIIYLLSLLMALSLVFASCKKNGGGDLTGPTPGEEPNTGDLPTDVNDKGLFTTEDALKAYTSGGAKIAEYKDKNYMRNPVITVVNGSTVVVFYEIRYQSPGSENDTALTGTNTVDIVYTVSHNAGNSFDGNVSYKYVGGQRATSYADSHGAPVVFYDKNNKKLVVVASGGIGLGVGAYKEDGGKNQSTLQYSVATVNDDGTISEFGQWQNIDVDLDVINQNLTGASSGVTFQQYGTHAARGVVADDNTLLLPVILGQFIKTTDWGTSKWGYVLFKGTKGTGDTYDFTREGSAVVMTVTDGTKATRIVSGASASSYVYITVSDRGTPVFLYSGEGNVAPSKSNIQAHDGAAGTLIVKDWRGTSYDPSSYNPDTTGTTQQALLSHVITKEKDFAIRRVDTKFKEVQGNPFYPAEELKNNAKSSSMDILKDGTIVMAVEGGQVAQGVLDGVQRPFYITFYRFSQAYLADQTK